MSKFENVIRRTLRLVDTGVSGNKICLEAIRLEIKKMEEQAKEQKTMDELFKDSGDLNEMIAKVAKDSKADKAKPSTKRSFQVYNELEQQAMKVLETCKKLKGTED